MIIVLDTDIISAFAKADALDEILKLFESQVYIVPAVYEELKKSLLYGYEYPAKIFQKVKTASLTYEEEVSKQLPININLGRGELESIILCLKRDWLFSTFDKVAIRFAEENGVKVFLFNTILRALLNKNICSIERIKEIINLIENRDKRKLHIEGVFD